MCIATSPDGKPINLSAGQVEKLATGKKMRVYDRCGGCEGGRALTHGEQNREKKESGSSGTTCVSIPCQNPGATRSG
jgi:hypothetical protein